MSSIKTFKVEAALPTLDEARRQVIAEIRKANREGVRVLKIIHGYGSSGRGGTLSIGLRRAFTLRKKEGAIRESFAGEDFFDLQRPDDEPAGNGADAAR